MPAMAIIAVGLTVASMAQQNAASKKAESTAKTTAAYNNALDITEAQQIDQASNTSIRQMREDAATYVDRQRGQYAASGIMADTGSPLSVQAETAGRLELQAQHKFMDAQNSESRAYSEGQAGLLYGQNQADQISMKATADTLSGAAKIAGMGYNAYQTYG